MSYGNFSEVYFAICLSENTCIKIGETSNARRRASQLCKEDYYITKVLDVEGEEAERLFVESFLRARIKATGRATQFRKDYFKCDNSLTADWFGMQFDEWVEEANAILRQMRSTESITFRPAFKSGRPIIPAGRESFYNEILESCDKRGYWRECYQFDTETQYEYLTQMEKTLTPYGYTCTTYRNYSWAHFRVEKKFA